MIPRKCSHVPPVRGTPITRAKALAQAVARAVEHNVSSAGAMDGNGELHEAELDGLSEDAQFSPKCADLVRANLDEAGCPSALNRTGMKWSKTEERNMINWAHSIWPPVPSTLETNALGADGRQDEEQIESRDLGLTDREDDSR